jgi:hypothetical protein
LELLASRGDRTTQSCLVLDVPYRLWTTFVECFFWFMDINDNTKDVKKLITEKCLIELKSESRSCDERNSLARSLDDSRPLWTHHIEDRHDSKSKP